jgi:hypothetical protein
MVFMTTAAMSPKYARAQDRTNLQNTFTDDDSIFQSNGADISQTAEAANSFLAKGCHFSP